ncbi:MAG: hypothetical protein WEB29_07745 [Chloroflexota bacterium]
MDYTNSPGTNQHPNNHDYQELEIIYSHLDSTTTVGSVVTGSATASGWGRLVSSSASKHSSIYRLDLGNGQSMLTHVIWAE